MSDHIKMDWLPAGWVCEQYPRQADVYVIDRPAPVGGGMVSLDFGLRVWNTGHQLPRSFPRDQERRYGGRGWKEQMVREACAYLEAAMTRCERPAPSASGAFHSDATTMAARRAGSEGSEPNGQEPSSDSPQ